MNEVRLFCTVRPKADNVIAVSGGADAAGGASHFLLALGGADDDPNPANFYHLLTVSVNDNGGGESLLKRFQRGGKTIRRHVNGKTVTVCPFEQTDINLPVLVGVSEASATPISVNKGGEGGEVNGVTRT